MSYLKNHGLGLELLAAKAGRLLPGGKRRAELELERRQEEERKASLERASKTKREEG